MSRNESNGQERYPKKQDVIQKDVGPNAATADIAIQNPEQQAYQSYHDHYRKRLLVFGGKCECI